jgi:hypothetical protein
MNMFMSLVLKAVRRAVLTFDLKQYVETLHMESLS